MRDTAMDMINWAYKSKKEKISQELSQINKYKVLISKRIKELGKSLLILINSLIKKNYRNASVTATHLTPTNKLHHYHITECEKESLSPNIEESENLNQKISTSFVASNNFDSDITEVAKNPYLTRKNMKKLVGPLRYAVVKTDYEKNNMTNQIFLLATCILLSVNAFGQTVIKKVKPSDTDPLITTFNTDSNYVYLNTSAEAKNILVIHLPGSFGEPKRTTLFGTLAADLGFHSIGLMYPNAPTVGSFCTSASDPNCFEHVRREIVEGNDYSTSIEINANECILNRVKKLILYLDNNFPAENWGQYLDTNNNIEYSKIIFSGHSQGGGHAALIAKYYPIKRATCFSSPKDWSNFFDSPPIWLSKGTWVTSPSNIYCFNHTLDEHSRQLEIWDSLGIDNYGFPVNIDMNSTP